MSYTEKDFEEFQANELGLDGTFHFECAMCGNCCRKRQEPIPLVGPDIFRVAYALGTSIEEMIAENTEGYIGHQSNVPLFVLKERLDGSCRLLRNGHCMIQANKPAVCALYPLGRYFDVRDQTFHYFVNPHTCQTGKETGKVWTLQEWLDEFHLRETEGMTAIWYKLLGGITNMTVRMNKSDIKGEFLNAILFVLYFGYDLKKPYIEQVKRNMDFAKEIFQAKFHKKIRF